MLHLMGHLMGHLTHHLLLHLLFQQLPLLTHLQSIQVCHLASLDLVLPAAHQVSPLFLHLDLVPLVGMIQIHFLPQYLNLLLGGLGPLWRQIGQLDQLAPVPLPLYPLVVKVMVA